MSPHSGTWLTWQRAIICFFQPYIKQDRPVLALLGALSLAMSACNGILIWIIGGVVTLAAAGAYGQVETTLLQVALVAALAQALHLAYALVHRRVSLRYIDRLRGAIYAHLMRVSFPVAQRYATGDLMTRLTSDVDRSTTFAINAPLNLFASLTVIAVYASLLVWIEWQLALIALGLTPLFFLAQHLVGPKTGLAARQFLEQKADLLSLEEQTLNNLRTVSAFNAASRLSTEHRDKFDHARRWTLTAQRLRLMHNSASTLLMFTIAVVIIYSGVADVAGGHLAIGALVSFLIYLRFLVNPVRNIATIPLRLHSDRAAAERVMEILTLAPLVKESASPRTLQVARGVISFDEVSFTYPDQHKPVFSRFDLRIAAGECVALVGPSGAGKSTFASLLLRFYDPTEGVIEIDGVDLREVSLASLREQICMVWQEPFLIGGSIRDNLLLAKADATQEEMISACKASFAWEFIARLPEGLDAAVGTKGSKLSVGQKQRLAIAQAFLRNGAILILDEATSGLDSHSEAQLVAALDALRKGRTTLIIAHRFSSIRRADRIVYFNGDGSIDAGTHAELMQRHAGYQRAVQWQTLDTQKTATRTDPRAARGQF